MEWALGSCCDLGTHDCLFPYWATEILIALALLQQLFPGKEENREQQAVDGARAGSGPVRSADSFPSP